VDPDALDMEALEKGKVPWSAEEFLEVFHWYEKLEKTPKDDWDLTERKALVWEESGEVGEWVFNPFHPATQFFQYMARRYPGPAASYHGYRFHQIMVFLEDYRPRLKAEGLARKTASGMGQVATQLLQALCELPFTRKIVVDGEDRCAFEYDEVVARAREIIEKGGEERKGRKRGKG
jgi:hypothetical protein